MHLLSALLNLPIQEPLGLIEYSEHRNTIRPNTKEHRESEQFSFQYTYDRLSEFWGTGCLRLHSLWGVHSEVAWVGVSCVAEVAAQFRLPPPYFK